MLAPNEVAIAQWPTARFYVFRGISEGPRAILTRATPILVGTILMSMMLMVKTSPEYDAHEYDTHGYDSHGQVAHKYDTRDDAPGYDFHRPDHYELEVQADRGGPASDPLAELARLIGRTDPFGSLPQRGSAPPHVSNDAPDYGSVDSDQSVYYRHGLDHGGADEHFESSTRDFGSEDRFGSQSPAPRGALAGLAELDARSDDAPAPHEEADFSHSRYRDHLPPLAPRATLASEAYLSSQEESAHPAPHFDPPDGSTDYGDVADDTSRHGDYGYEADPADEYQADEYRYEGAPAKRRYPLKVAVAVLGLAVFGTAGAFGYRTVFKGGSHQGPPPVIHADNTPTKIVPSGTSGESGSKPINERLGDTSRERMVKREEFPVQLPNPAVPLAAVTNAPSPSGAAAPPIAPAVAPPATSSPNPPAAAAGGTSEPKRVRTVSIRADQALSSGAPATRVATRTAALAPGGYPSSPSGGAPLALTPQAVNAAAGVVGSTDSTHARPRGGSFVVQLSAQKSESDAESAFHAMQARYAVLGGRQLLIRRKDQGERGVFYVAQVGPFGTKDEAIQMCESLKSAGGTCFVQKN